MFGDLISDRPEEADGAVDVAARVVKLDGGRDEGKRLGRWPFHQGVYERLSLIQPASLDEKVGLRRFQHLVVLRRDVQQLVKLVPCLVQLPT